MVVASTDVDAWWDFNEGSGDPLDSSGNNRTLTRINAAWTTTGALFDYNLSFDGAGDYLYRTIFNPQSADKVTAWFWAKIPPTNSRLSTIRAGTGNLWFLSYYDGAQNPELSIMRLWDNTESISFRIEAGDYVPVSPEDDDQYHLFLYQFNKISGQGSFYFDNVLTYFIYNQTWNSLRTNSNGRFWVGRNGNASQKRYFNGNMQQMGIVSEMFSAEQRGNLYNAGAGCTYSNFFPSPTIARIADEVKINNIDVTNYRTIWKIIKEWKVAIDGAVITLAPEVTNVITPSNGQEVTIKRGRTTATDEFLFQGQITQIKPSALGITCVCKGPIYDAIKSAQTYTWDKDIDIEAGVGSEIFKAICDNSQLSYDSSSIISTGTAEINKIVKFVQRDEDDFQKMNELAELYDYIITYDYANGWVNFKPQGFQVYSSTLTVGSDIPAQIKWKENMEALINEIKILGATVYDKVVDTLAGPATTMTLSKMPEDTEVRDDHAGADNLLVRGVKDVGVFGTDYDYYVEVDQKKITFAIARSDIWVRYGAQVPMPVTVRNQASVDLYGGPNKIAHFKRFSFNDLKDITDAENRGKAILAKYSTPFITAENIPISDDTIKINGTIEPGTVVTINDQAYNNRTEIVFVQKVQYSWPHVYDKITVGDQIYRTEDWQVSQMQKVNQLFAELNKNEDVIVSIIAFLKTINIRRSSFLTSYIKVCDSFIVGHPVNGLIGNGTVLDEMEIGAAHWINADYTITNSADQHIVGNNSLKCVKTGGSDFQWIRNTVDSFDLSAYSGVASGAPTKGTIGFWLYLNSATDIGQIIMEIGTYPNYLTANCFSYASVSGYDNWGNLTLQLQPGWNYMVVNFLKGFVVGTPDWTNSYITIYVATSGTPTFYIDYLTVSQSNYIGLNGIGSRKMIIT